MCDVNDGLRVGDPYQVQLFVLSQWQQLSELSTVKTYLYTVLNSVFELKWTGVNYSQFSGGSDSEVFITEMKQIHYYCQNEIDVEVVLGQLDTEFKRKKWPKM